jgi:hypothetical protein
MPFAFLSESAFSFAGIRTSVSDLTVMDSLTAKRLCALKIAYAARTML